MQKSWWHLCVLAVFLALGMLPSLHLSFIIGKRKALDQVMLGFLGCSKHP